MLSLFSIGSLGAPSQMLFQNPQNLCIEKIGILLTARRCFVE